MHNTNVLVIIPAYNEEENIVRVVESLKATCSMYDYVVVNDGSRDHTAQICRERGYALLDLPVNLGLAGAFQAGMRYAHRFGYDYLIQFDGDGQHRPEYIEKMLQEMQEKDLDIVIGSRFVEEKKQMSARMLGSRLLTAVIHITTGKKIMDPTSGMRLFNKQMIIEFSSSLNYGPEPDTVAYLVKSGARVGEVQVQMDERIAGESYLTLGRSIRYMMNMSISILFIQFFRKRG